MMAKAGYNPIEMARFFEKLEAQGGASGPQFLSAPPESRESYAGDPGGDSVYAARQLYDGK